MLQAGKETLLTLRQSDILPQSYRYIYAYFYIYALGYRSAQFMRRALHLRVFDSQQFPTRDLNQLGVGSIHTFSERRICDTMSIYKTEFNRFDTKVKKISVLYYLPVAGGRILGCIPLPSVLAQSEI